MAPPNPYLLKTSIHEKNTDGIKVYSTVIEKRQTTDTEKQIKNTKDNTIGRYDKILQCPIFAFSNPILLLMIMFLFSITLTGLAPYDWRIPQIRLSFTTPVPSRFKYCM